MHSRDFVRATGVMLAASLAGLPEASAEGKEPPARHEAVRPFAALRPATPRIPVQIGASVGSAFPSGDDVQIDALISVKAMTSIGEGTDAPAAARRVIQALNDGAPPVPQIEIEPVMPRLDLKGWAFAEAHLRLGYQFQGRKEPVLNGTSFHVEAAALDHGFRLLGEPGLNRLFGKADMVAKGDHWTISVPPSRLDLALRPETGAASFEDAKVDWRVEDQLGRHAAKSTQGPSVSFLLPPGRYQCFATIDGRDVGSVSVELSFSDQQNREIVGGARAESGLRVTAERLATRLFDGPATEAPLIVVTSQDAAGQGPDVGRSQAWHADFSLPPGHYTVTATLGDTAVSASDVVSADSGIIAFRATFAPAHVILKAQAKVATALGPGDVTWTIAPRSAPTASIDLKGPTFDQYLPAGHYDVTVHGGDESGSIQIDVPYNTLMRRTVLLTDR